VIQINKRRLTSKKTNRLHFRLSEKMLVEFNKKCKEEEVTKSEVLRECIRRFLKKKK